MRCIAILALMLMISAPTQGQKLGDLLGKAKKVLSGEGLSNEDIGMGLKEALNLGIIKGVNVVSKTDGYLAKAGK